MSTTDTLENQVKEIVDEAGIDIDVLKVWDKDRYSMISLGEGIEKIFKNAKAEIPQEVVLPGGKVQMDNYFFAIKELLKKLFGEP